MEVVLLGIIALILRSRRRIGAEVARGPVEVVAGRASGWGGRWDNGRSQV